MEKEKPRPRVRDINKIIIHCTATREGQDVSVETIRDWHLKRGWSDIGYHYIILLDGSVQIGRPVERIGAHCKGQNKSSIGIAYVGGVESDGETPKDTRTKEQKQSMQKMLIALMEIFEGVTIHGHNEFGNKACPSFDVQKEFKHITE